MSNFDYYAASIPAKPEAVDRAITAAFPDADRSRGKGKNGYTDMTIWSTGKETNAKLLHGGNRDAWPHAWASGDRAPRFAEMVRQQFPVHRVTRADIAEDFDDPTAFDKLTNAGCRVADRLGIKVTHVGDYHRAQAGRTMNFGSRKTGSVIRVYEKGKQLPLAGRPDWTRCELEAHPVDNQRLASAIIEPDAFYGLRAWTQAAAEELLDLEIVRLLQTPPTPTDDERSYAWMLKQYRGMLKRRMTLLGPVQFFSLLQDELA